MAKQLQDRLTAEGLPCALEMRAVWIARGTQGVLVAGRRITSQPIAHSGHHFWRGQMQRAVCCCMAGVLESKEVAPQPAPPSQVALDEVGTESSPGSGLRRMVMDLEREGCTDNLRRNPQHDQDAKPSPETEPTKNDELWVEWQVSPLRRSRHWIQQMLGTLWAHKMLVQCGTIWIG